MLNPTSKEFVSRTREKKYKERGFTLIPRPRFNRDQMDLLKAKEERESKEKEMAKLREKFYAEFLREQEGDE